MSLTEIRALAPTLPKAARHALLDAYVFGLGKALGKDAAKDGKALVAIGKAFGEGFVRALGSATAFIVVFLILYWAFRDVAARLLRVALGSRGVAVSAALTDDVPSRTTTSSAS